LRCWTGCRFSDICKALGKRECELFHDHFEKGGGRIPVPTERKIVAEYNYVNEDGELLYQKLRFEPKNFAIRRPGAGADGWEWGLGDAKRILYRLPELLARPTWPVLFVEGERDVDRLTLMGLVATCNYDGAGGDWLDSYAEVLKDRRVIVIPDSDEPGIRHARQYAGALLECAASVRLVRLPEGTKDISDFVGSRDDLVRHLKAVAEWWPIAADLLG